DHHAVVRCVGVRIAALDTLDLRLGRAGLGAGVVGKPAAALLARVRPLVGQTLEPIGLRAAIGVALLVELRIVDAEDVPHGVRVDLHWRGAGQDVEVGTDARTLPGRVAGHVPGIDPADDERPIWQDPGRSLHPRLGIAADGHLLRRTGNDADKPGLERGAGLDAGTGGIRRYLLVARPDHRPVVADVLATEDRRRDRSERVL